MWRYPSPIIREHKASPVPFSQIGCQTPVLPSATSLHFKALGRQGSRRVSPASSQGQHDWHTFDSYPNDATNRPKRLA
jgi:hypothetical protein